MVILCRKVHQGQLEENGMVFRCWSWVLDYPVAANRVSRISQEKGIEDLGGIKCTDSVPLCKDRWTKRGGELGLFQFLKQSIATLTYAKLVGHQFTNRITKLLTQAKRDKTK